MNPPTKNQRSESVRSKGPPSKKLRTKEPSGRVDHHLNGPPLPPLVDQVNSKPPNLGGSMAPPPRPKVRSDKEAEGLKER